MDDQNFRRVFEFNEEDLAANKSGLLTNRQKTRLKRRSLALRVMKLVLSLICLAAGAVILLALSAVILQLSDPSERIVWPAFFAIFALGFFALSLFLAWKGLRRPSLTVEKVEGPVGLALGSRGTYLASAHATSYSPVYMLIVGNRKFEIPSKKIQGLEMKGGLYAVYFVAGKTSAKSDDAIPYSNILSIELVSDQLFSREEEPVVLWKLT